MDQKDNKFPNQETQTNSQGQDRNMHKGHDKSQQPLGLPAQAGISFIVRKAEKLTTALYMVTDIMPEKEPMKWKVRETGVELLSDIMVTPASGSSERMTILRNAAKKIEQIVSFLDVAQSARMMSEMNASVLKKEYVALKDACLIEWQCTSDWSKNIFTESFFEVHDGQRSSLGSGGSHLGEAGRLRVQPSEVAPLNIDETKNASQVASRSEEIVRMPIATQKISQGQQVDHREPVLEQKQFQKTTREESLRFESQDGLRSGLSLGRPDLGEVAHLGNQHQEKNLKDTTTITHTETEKAVRSESQTAAPKAASPIRPILTPRATVSPTGIIERPRQDVGRDDRRKIILALIKQKPALTVKDIARSIPGVSEKTIQRELFAMVAEGILTKKGDRRWSTYSLAV